MATRKHIESWLAKGFEGLVDHFDRANIEKLSSESRKSINNTLEILKNALTTQPNEMVNETMLNVLFVIAFINLSETISVYGIGDAKAKELIIKSINKAENKLGE